MFAVTCASQQSQGLEVRDTAFRLESRTSKRITYPEYHKPFGAPTEYRSGSTISSAQSQCFDPPVYRLIKQDATRGASNDL